MHVLAMIGVFALIFVGISVLGGVALYFIRKNCGGNILD